MIASGGGWVGLEFEADAVVAFLQSFRSFMIFGFHCVLRGSINGLMLAKEMLSLVSERKRIVTV